MNIGKSILAVIILSVLLLFGCSKQDNHPVSTFKMTGQKIRIHLATNGIIPSLSMYSDRNYAVPSKNWVAGAFSDSFFSFKQQLASSNWTAEENDCDDFARFSAFFAQYLHHNTPNKLKNTALSFGEFLYETKELQGHAINIFLYREQEKVKIGFYEPQTCKIVILTKEEIESCYFIKF